MTIPAIIIGIIFVLALTTPVVTVAVGLEPEGQSKFPRQFLAALIFGASEALMAFLGYLFGKWIAPMYGDYLPYFVFAIMIIVAIKMIVHSMKVLKAKYLFSFVSNWGFLILGIFAAIDTFMMGVCGDGWLPFGHWYFLAVAIAGFLWAFISARKEYSPKMMRSSSFIEFSGAVFLVVIAILYLFTDLI
jgi:putative Mn2+ efflux pump MntP